MARKSRADARGDMLQGTLDMLILKTLITGPAHGHTIANVIEKSSDEVLQVEHGSLYPALHRLEDLGLIAAFWGTSENNRKAKYLPDHAGRAAAPAGRAQPMAPARRRGDAGARAGNGVANHAVATLFRAKQRETTISRRKSRITSRRRPTTTSRAA